MSSFDLSERSKSHSHLPPCFTNHTYSLQISLPRSLGNSLVSALDPSEPIRTCRLQSIPRVIQTKLLLCCRHQTSLFLQIVFPALPGSRPSDDQPGLDGELWQSNGFSGWEIQARKVQQRLFDIFHFPGREPHPFLNHLQFSDWG